MPKREVLHNEKGQEICGARRSRDGEPCRETRLGVGGRCKYHGGASIGPGPAHPAWKHGRTSQMMRRLPKHMREAFETSVSDPDILSMRDEMGLLDSRILTLIERLSAGGSIGDAIAEVSKVKDMLEDEDVESALKSVATIEELLNTHANDDRTWEEVLGAIEARRRVSETERRLIEAKQASVDAAQLRGILSGLLAVVSEAVLPLNGGRVAVEAIAVEIRKMIGMQAQPQRALYPREEEAA